jgi:chemotaxis protein CheX
MGNAAESITLPTELDIKAAGPLTTQLLGLRGKDVTLNASQIERVGAQCLQVLLSAASTWTADGAELVISEPSPAFTDAIEIAGLELSRFSARNN